MSVDVVVHAGAGRSSVLDCVQALRRHSGEIRLLVVDDCAGDEASSWLQAQRDLHVIDGMGAGRAAAFNAGFAETGTERVAFVSSQVVVSEGWLELLGRALESSPEVAAVGPTASRGASGAVSPLDGIGNQWTVATYDDLEDFRRFAAAYNHCDPVKWARTLRLSDQCLLARRRPLAELDGGSPFDESYTLGLFADDDLSLRLVSAGKALLRCGDVLVHLSDAPPLDPEQARFAEMERLGLEARWGFAPSYSMLPRPEIVELVEGDAPVRVLDLGCACGATLLEIANRHPGSELYGVEANKDAAAVAGAFATVVAGDAEAPLDYPPQFFDYVICADVLEHLREPWAVLERLRPLLKPEGRVVASIPNLMHVSVLGSLLRGRFTYQDAGILDRTHLRFFTHVEIDELFARTGYSRRDYRLTTVALPAEQQRLAEQLSATYGVPVYQYLAYQYLVVARP